MPLDRVDLTPYHRNYPNVLLIIDPGPFFVQLLMAFYRYANVFPVFWHIGYYHRLYHGLHVLRPLRRYMSPSKLRFFSIFFNPRHPVNAMSIPHDKYDDIDLVFVSDPVICRLDLKKFRNAVKAYWAQDCIYDKTKYVQLAGTLLESYDYVFVAHKACIKEYREITGARVEWLPYAFSPEVYKPHKIGKVYDASFVGGFTGIGSSKRINTINYIKRAKPNLKIFYGSGIYIHDLARVYSASKVVLNISRVGESNMRDFEALGCRAALLRDYSDEVAEIFRDRVHLVFYRDLEDLLDRLEEMLENEDLRERIAEEGHREAMEKHTMDHRVKFILETTRLWKI